MSVQAPNISAQDDPFGTAFPTTPSTTPVGPTTRSADDGPKETDAVVLSIRASNPTTPIALSKAVRIMLDLGRADEASTYLTTLVGLDIDEAAQYALYEEMGADFFLQLYRSADLGEEAVQFASDVIQASAKQSTDPARLAKLIGELSSPNSSQRNVAYRQLHRLGETAVKPLVSVLLDSSRTAEYPVIREALIGLRREAVGPLVGVLESSNTTARIYAANALGEIGDADELPYLLRYYLASADSAKEHEVASNAIEKLSGVTPNVDEAEQALHRFATLRFDRSRNGFSNDSGDLVWRWDEAQMASVPVLQSSVNVDQVVASQFADVLYERSPEDIGIRRLYLTALLESTMILQGLDRPLADGPERQLLASHSNEIIIDLMKYALDVDCLPAATAAVEVLGDKGEASILQTANGSTSPLAAALLHPNRRLRFAAAQAILKINPQTPFAGCSNLGKTLSYLVTGGGGRRVLIGHSLREQTQTLVGQLAELGFATDIAINAREVLQLVNEKSDYDFIMVSDSLPGLETSLLVQQVRKSPRTADLPVGILALRNDISWSERIAETDPLTFAFHWPYHGPNVALDHLRRTLISKLEFSDEQVVVIGHSNQAEADLLEAQISGLGFETAVYTDATAMLKRLEEEPNLNLAVPRFPVTFIILGKMTGAEDVGEFIIQMRRLPLTKETSVGLMTKAQNLVETEEIAVQAAAVEVFPWPNEGANNVAFVARQLIGAAGAQLVSPQERFKQAQASLAGMLQLATDSRSYFSTMRHEEAIISALFTPGLNHDASQLLGMLGSPRAQRQLIGFASHDALSLVDRQNSANAFRQAVEARGTLLTKAEILRQYDRYNNSQNKAVEIQQLLGSILDAIETKVQTND